MCVRVHMYAYAYVCRYIYICAFFYSECCMHFRTGVFGTSAWADMYVTQVCFWHQRTHLRTHSLQVVYMCVYACVCVYACICIWMRMCVYDIAWHAEALFLRISICAYVCVCMRMYMCAHVFVYGCMCICMYMYICMSVYMYWYTITYTRVWVYICTRVGTFRLFVLSNLCTTCACITGVS